MVCPILLAVGFVILMVSEFSGLAALRIVAVGVLLAGALGGGVRAGLAVQPPALLQKIAARFTHRLARVLVVLLLLPVVLSLVLTLLGAVLRPHADQVSAVALNAGALLALLLLAVIGAAGAVSLRALRAAEGQS
jgi:hypothetical protein